MNGKAQTLDGVALAHTMALARSLPLVSPPQPIPTMRMSTMSLQNQHPRGTGLHVGVIFNKKARHNLSGERARALATDGIAHAAPESHADLAATLAQFAARGVNALVIDGGDGTLRDVTTMAADIFGGRLPLLSLVPSGKTNALALDLGIPAGWTVEAALGALRAGRIVQRAPIEIVREGSAHVDLRGFIFGTGAFVRATEIAQRTHRLGAFNGLAIGLSILGGVTQTIFGRRDNVWRRGDPVRIACDDDAPIDRRSYLMIASTLKHLPVGIKLFGAPREGLKLLAIDAPPRGVIRSLSPLLTGRDSARLAAAGYHRLDPRRVTLTLDDFILDGEVYPGGAMTLTQGAPVDFAAP